MTGWFLIQTSARSPPPRAIGDPHRPRRAFAGLSIRSFRAAEPNSSRMGLRRPWRTMVAMPVSRQPKQRFRRIASAARRLAGPPAGLEHCPGCRKAFVCPLAWEVDGPEHWLIDLRCGACGLRRDVRISNAEATAFDLTLDRQTAQIARELARSDRERMHHELHVFVAALARDLIDAADFAR